MLTLPAEWCPLMVEFAPLFSKPVWEHPQLLLVGASLAPGKRTVTAGLRVMAWSQEKRVVNSHRVLNRARWSPLAASSIWLRLLLMGFAPEGEWVFGLDDPIEPRRGEHLTAKGIYRHPLRSSHRHLLKASSLRWLGLRVLTQVSWAGSTWGLPFLSVLCPSQRYPSKRRRRHQKLTERARQRLRLRTRWLPHRQLILVGDGGFSALELLHDVSQTPHAHLITRLRLDAEWWTPAPERKPHPHGRPRLKGARRPSPKPRLDDPHTLWRTLEVDPLLWP